MSVGFLDIRAIWGITPVAVRSYDLSFLYSGRDWYSARHADEEYRRFTAATGIRLGTSIDADYHRGQWRGTAPSVEIVVTDFAVVLAGVAADPDRRDHYRPDLAGAV